MLFSAHCSWLCKTILTLYLSRLCYLSPAADPAFELRRGPALIFFSHPAFLPSVISSFFTQNSQHIFSKTETTQKQRPTAWDTDQVS